MIFGFITLLFMSATSADFVVFVAPNGNDVTGDGSITNPFATLTHARDAARLNRSVRRSIMLRGGTYYLASPLDINSEDSGFPGSPFTITAYNGEAATVSAGREVLGWEATQWPGAPQGAVYSAALPPGAGRGGTLLSLRVRTAGLGDTFLVKSSRYPLMRGYGDPASWAFTQAWTSAKGGGSSDEHTLWPWAVGIDAAMRDAVATPTETWMELFGTTERDVMSQLARVQSFMNDTNATMTVMLYGGQGAMPPATRMALYNVRSALVPGSMYTDATAGVVYLWPDPAWGPDWTAFAPLHDTAIALSGVEWVTISNLTFTDTNFNAEGFWIGPAWGPSDAAITVSDSRNVRVASCTFSAGCGGYGVGITNGSSAVEVTASLFDRMGQGGVTMYGTNEPAPSTQPFGITVSHNVMRDLGLLLKHVAGVVLRSASDCHVHHNVIARSSRYALEVDSFMQPGMSRLSLNNLFEYNVIDGACLETDDCGAIEVIGSGNYIYSGNTFRYNNVTNIVDACSSDGETVCVHGQPAGSPSCRNFGWGVYLDGSESGSTFYGNVIDATLSGAVFFNSGGANNVTNNIFLMGTYKQIDMAIPMDGVPGDILFRNIFSFQNTAATIYGMEAGWQPAKLSAADNNLFFCPGLDVMNTTGHALFPAGGGGLIAWRNATKGLDAHSVVGDPLFVDAANGDFGLLPGSPAWALGWVAIPPIEILKDENVGAPR